MLTPLKVLTVKAGSGMVIAATSDAFIGATATIVVGLLAALSAIGVAWLQNRQNNKREEVVNQVMDLTNQLRDLEHQRNIELEAQLQKEREGRVND